jgi:esterase/lipase superfamily enzyme
MELLVHGHAGARVLVFPTSLGRFHEWEDRGMVSTLADQLENGWLQLFCVDSVDAESWYAKGKWPGDRAWRQELYDRYILHEVVPFTRQRNANEFQIVTGASLGAYHAVNFAFRHPHVVGRVLGMSGMYNIKELTGGYSDENVFAHDPSHYMSNYYDASWYDAVRRIDIILVVGREDPHYADNEHLSNVLWSRGIWHALRPWDGWAHDWPWWQQMVGRYIGGGGEA